MQVEPEGEVLVEPLSILDQREVQLRKRVITQVKVQWRHFGPDEATWEDEELMRKTYPDLFSSEGHRDSVQSQGEECNHQIFYVNKLLIYPVVKDKTEITIF